MRLRQGLFWAGAVPAGWIVVGYPLTLALLPARSWRTDSASPSVTVLLPTYREREQLAEKLRGLAEADYPSELLQVVVVADGDPELARIARRAYPEATVIELPQRSGKPVALNRGLAESRGEIILLTDAHTPIAPESIRLLVRHFADPSVAGVSGRWAERESAYDRYEHALRKLESRSGSIAGVFGGLFAVRRSQLPDFPEDVINDDLWILCRLASAGGRVVYEPAASAVESGLTARREVARRSRIGAGRALLVRELTQVPPGFAWRLASHKFGRLLLPFLLLATWLSSLSLARRPGYRVAAAAQTGIYAAGLLTAAGLSLPGPLGVIGRSSRQMLLGNAAVALGVVRAARGAQDVRWEAVR